MSVSSRTIERDLAYLQKKDSSNMMEMRKKAGVLRNSDRLFNQTHT